MDSNVAGDWRGGGEPRAAVESGEGAIGAVALKAVIARRRRYGLQGTRSKACDSVRAKPSATRQGATKPTVYRADRR